MAFRLGAQALAGGYRLSAFDTIGSTSAEALARARAGDPGRLWVVAEAQSAGHGRRGRPWQTPPGNLAASLLLRVAAPPAQAATLGFAAGLAVKRAIGTCVESASLDGEAPGTSAAELRLKWPNDVLLEGKKVAGILLEASVAEGSHALVVGIGVNVRHAPEGLPYPATSLAAAGLGIAAADLFAALSDAWLIEERLWDEGRGFGDLRERWLRYAAGLGGPIAVQLGGEVLEGTFETIDSEGRLVVRENDGAARRVAAGEVHFGAAATAGRA